MHCLLLQFGGNVFEGRKDRWEDNFRVKVEVWRERRRYHVIGELKARRRAGDVDARGTREAYNTHCEMLVCKEVMKKRSNVSQEGVKKCLLTRRNRGSLEDRAGSDLQRPDITTFQSDTRTINQR